MQLDSGLQQSAYRSLFCWMTAVYGNHHCSCRAYREKEEFVMQAFYWVQLQGEDNSDVSTFSALLCRAFFKNWSTVDLHTVLCQFQVYSKMIQLYIYIFFFRSFSIIGYYKILNIVPCAIQQVLVVYLFYVQQCVSVNPKLLNYPPPCFPFGNHKFVFNVYESVSVL